MAPEDDAEFHHQTPLSLQEPFVLRLDCDPMITGLLLGVVR